MTATFAEWIAPLSLADFRAKAAAARLFPITGALGGGANAPLPWTLIERLQYEDVVQADHFYLGLRGVAVPKSVSRNPAGALALTRK